MKKTFIIMILFFSQTIFAYKMYSKMSFNVTTGLAKNLVIECSASDQLCQKTCGLDKMCIILESICTDCASQKNHEMNMLYSSNASDFFQSKDKINDDIIAYFLSQKKIMSISYDLFLNYYTPELSNEIAIIFGSICQNGSNENLMLAEIDSNTLSIVSIPAIVCIDAAKNAQIHELAYNPLYSSEKINFWQQLQAESEKAYKRMGLKLHVSYGNRNSLVI